MAARRLVETPIVSQRTRRSPAARYHRGLRWNRPAAPDGTLNSAKTRRDGGALPAVIGSWADQRDRDGQKS